MLSEEKLREIRDSVDLVALISEYVPLRRMGARFVGLCPFHTEKTPSFGVSRGKPFYYCFGCQATGDAITFVRHVEGLGFMEAVEKLAERAGIEVERSDDVGQIALRNARARRERLAELMGLAQAFYEQQLYEHPHAAIARAELEKRKVRDEVARTFHLGYAPLGWDGLSKYLTAKGVNLDEAAEVGLIAQRREGNGHYDRFRHRLMFPVADQHGRIIAFSGRALAPPEGSPPERDPPAKYINSPEGPLYKKGQALFGLSTARVAMRKHNQVLLCEGNFDLVAIHQAGFEQVLAPLGTSFTLEQAKLIRRFAEEVIVIFDGDGAGRKATATAFELLTQAGLQGRAIRLPDGDDPDSFIAKNGAEAFAGMVKQAPPMLDFLIAEASYKVTDVASRTRAIQWFAPHLERLDSVQRRHYEQELTRRLLLKTDGLVFESHIKDVRAELRRGLGQNSDRRRSEDTGAQPATTSLSPEKATIRMRAAHELPERQRLVLGVLLDHPDLLTTVEQERLAGLLTDSDLRAIFLATAQMLTQRGEVDALALLEGLSSNPARAWLGQRLSEVPAVDRERDRERAERLLAEGLPMLERDRKNEQRAQLKRDIQIANQTGNQALAQELTRRRDELAKT